MVMPKTMHDMFAQPERLYREVLLAAAFFSSFSQSYSSGQKSGFK